MKNSFIISVFVLVTTGMLSAQQPADRFAATKTRIDTLLNQRLKAAPLPDKPENPFQFTQGTPVSVPSDLTPTQPVSDILSGDDQILAFGVSRLRITGLVLRGGVYHLLINTNTYRDGDLVPVRGSGETVYYIRVTRISDREVTFRYNDASVAVPLPN